MIIMDFDFDIKCLKCMDTGEYFNGSKMIHCSCEEGKVKKKESSKVKDTNEHSDKETNTVSD